MYIKYITIAHCKKKTAIAAIGQMMSVHIQRMLRHYFHSSHFSPPFTSCRNDDEYPIYRAALLYSSTVVVLYMG